MQSIIARSSRSTLADFASSSVVVGFDYDGTLAPIVSSPARARMRASTRRLLSRLATCYPCVVISGRSLDDLAGRLKGLPLWSVFGNHGLEPWASSEAAAERVRGWVARLADRLGGYPGLVIEDKKYSATIHYRNVRDKARVRRAIAEAVRGLRRARAIEGTQAVNLVVRGAPAKGEALQAARRLLRCDTAIYVGDDDTDEDAFASAPRHQLLSVRIGPSKATSAGYRLRAQAEIDALLELLLSLRGRRLTGPAQAGSSRTLLK